MNHIMKAPSCILMPAIISFGIRFMLLRVIFLCTTTTSIISSKRSSAPTNLFFSDAFVLSSLATTTRTKYDECHYDHRRGLNTCSIWLTASDGRKKRTKAITSFRKSNFELCALKRKQTAIYDGSEFVSIASVLKNQQEEASDLDDMIDDDYDNMLSYQVPSMRSGFITFLTGTIENGENNSITNEEKILGVQVDAITFSDKSSLVKIDDNIYIHKDSMVKIPKGISDHDAISTASAALAGVYCSFGPMDEKVSDSQQQQPPKKAVVLGGGDYACFIAKALDCLGVKVTLVTTRPMSLKDTPLNPLYRSNGKCRNKKMHGTSQIFFAAYFLIS